MTPERYGFEVIAEGGITFEWDFAPIDAARSRSLFEGYPPGKRLVVFNKRGEALGFKVGAYPNIVRPTGRQRVPR